MKIFLKIVIVFFPAVFFLTNCFAERLNETHYSIHLASFKLLQNANKYTNSLKTKEKTVFWKKTDVPGKGMFYRVYLGRYDDREKAMKVWNKLKIEGAVSYCGIYEFHDHVVFNSKLNIKRTVEKGQKNQYANNTKKRFIDNKDGTITDNATKLMWIKNGWRLDFFSSVTWNDAVRSCRDFKHGSYTDWKLPTVKQWKSLIDTEMQFPALVEPNPFVNIVVHASYWTGTGIQNKKLHAYAVSLYSGEIHRQRKKERAFILPVRKINENNLERQKN